MQTRYFDLLDDCAAREDVRAIVLTGAGRGFCAGADMESLQALSGGDGERTAPRTTSARSRTHSDPEAGDRRDQRRLRRARAGPRGHVRPALRRRRGEADHRLRAPGPRRRARARVDAAAPGRSGARARPAAVGADRARAPKRPSWASSTAPSRTAGARARRSSTPGCWPRSARPRAWRDEAHRSTATTSARSTRAVEEANRLMAESFSGRTSPRACRASWSAAPTSRRWLAGQPLARRRRQSVASRPARASPSMRVLLISWEYPPVIEGGLARHVRKLVRAPGRRGGRGARADPRRRPPAGRGGAPRRRRPPRPRAGVPQGRERVRPLGRRR